MANLGAGQEHPTEEEAVDLAEGLSAGSQHEVAAASAAGLEGPYIQAEKIEPREKRRVPSRRLVLGALVAVALALVLATMMTKKLPSVGVPPPVEAPEGAKKEPPVEDETQQEPEKPPTIASPGGPEEEAEVVEEKSGVPPPVEAREGVKKEPQVVSEEPKEPKEPRSVGTAGGPGDEPEVVVPTPGTPPPVEAPEKIKKEPQDAGEEGDELEIGRKPPGVEEKPEEPEGPPSVETPGGPEVEPELVVHTLETPPPVGAPEEIKKEPDVLWESLEEAKEGKKPPVVEEKPGEPEKPPDIESPGGPEEELKVVEETPKGLPPVKAPEGVEKDMQLIEKEREETEVGWGSQVEEESEDSDVEEEWDFDKALEEWDSSEESEGEEEQEEEIRCLLNDLKINMVNIVKWALQTRTDTPLSGSKAREVALEQHVVRNGLRYEILARFTRLTPEYDPRQTAIALAEGLPIFFQNCLLLEDEARTSPGAAVTGEDFGDEETGKLNVFITGRHVKDARTFWKAEVFKDNEAC